MLIRLLIGPGIRSDCWPGAFHGAAWNKRAGRCFPARWSQPLLAMVSILWGATGSWGADRVSFSRDIRPILAAKCWACHGPDEASRQADLRLDQREGALAPSASGTAIVPGKPADSLLMSRITSSDPEVRMPPPEAKQSLTAPQIDLLRRWIEEGASYDPHWAFTPPSRPAVPPSSPRDWIRNPIDAFVLATMKANGFQPAPCADRYSLVRRLYLDLIGIPPTPEQADDFVHDDDPQAYEQLVDRLLASVHFGERWARPWLDLARYADTNGYEKDRQRSIWPYRDWVIDALNADLPYDQFSIEQLAGDMLPSATRQQRVATGFHRNTMLNEEGGIDPLEFRFLAMVDRVAATGAIWLGLTVGCAQCHSHKYDPISHTEYYGLMALLNNADEPDLAVDVPAVVKQRERILQQIARFEDQLADAIPVDAGGDAGEGDTASRRARRLEVEFSTWLDQLQPQATRWRVLRPSRLTSPTVRLDLLEDGSIFSRGDITKRDVFELEFDIERVRAAWSDGNNPLQETPTITAFRLEVMPDDRLPAGGPGRAYYEGPKGDFFLSEWSASSPHGPLTFDAGAMSYGKLGIRAGDVRAENVFDGDGSTGWSAAEAAGRPHHLIVHLKEPWRATEMLRMALLFERHFASSLGRFKILATDRVGLLAASPLPLELEQILVLPRGAWTTEQQAALRRHFLLTTPLLAEARQPIDALRASLPSLPETMVMEERLADHPRPTHRRHRGEYLSPREEVSPGVPAIFPPLPADEPANRLTLARWMVSEKNPLAARVAMNRSWRAFFGRGFVDTIADLGSQSELPTHPDLLDWLSVEFRERGWSLKHMVRLIVTSATYQQSSTGSAESLLQDPANRWLARGPRFRVEAEIVRDIMLQASRLLNPTVGGPSVFPPQPASVTAMAYGGFVWSPADPYRRSLYTFAKRTAPFAAYLVFDGPTGEECLAQRDRSNTPLQALTMLNDPMFVEMARAVAEQVLREPGLDTRQRAQLIFRRFLTRPADDNELSALSKFYDSQLARLQSGPLEARSIGGGTQPSPELAAWTMTARAIMNLDETITKQ